MRYYELTCLISTNLSETELKNLQDKIKTLIQEEGGVLAEAKKTANLIMLNFSLAPDKLGSLEKKLKSENQILRYLILSKKVPKMISPLAKIPITRIPKVEKIKKEKVKLQEIEEKLEEILGET